MKNNMENYKNSISNYQLNPDEMFCSTCNRVVKNMNLRRHSNSKSHENNIVKLMASKIRNSKIINEKV